MSKEKFCGNCKHFTYECMDGSGICEVGNFVTRCDEEHSCGYEPRLGGWTEITLDNVDLIDSDRVVVTDRKEYRMGIQN